MTVQEYIRELKDAEAQRKDLSNKLSNQIYELQYKRKAIMADFTKKLPYQPGDIVQISEDQKILISEILDAYMSRDGLMYVNLRAYKIKKDNTPYTRATTLYGVDYFALKLFRKRHVELKKRNAMNKTRAIRALTSAKILLTDEDDRSDLDCISLAASEIETALEELRTSNVDIRPRRPAVLRHHGARMQRERPRRYVVEPPQQQPPSRDGQPRLLQLSTTRGNHALAENRKVGEKSK